MKAFADLADLPEDERIRVIGETAERTFQRIGFVVEDDEKADRYVEELARRFPRVQVISRGPGPVEHTMIVAVKRRADA